MVQHSSSEGIHKFWKYSNVIKDCWTVGVLVNVLIQIQIELVQSIDIIEIPLFLIVSCDAIQY